MKTLNEYFEHNDFMNIEVTRYKTPNTKESVKAILNKILKNKEDDIEIEMHIRHGYKIKIVTIEQKISTFYLGIEDEEWFYDKDKNTLDDIVAIINDAMKHIEEDR